MTSAGPGLTLSEAGAVVVEAGPEGIEVGAMVEGGAEALVVAGALGDLVVELIEVAGIVVGVVRLAGGLHEPPSSAAAKIRPSQENRACRTGIICDTTHETP